MVLAGTTRRPAAVAAAVLFAGNGIATLVSTVALAFSARTSFAIEVTILLFDAITVGALLVIPFVFPARRLGRRGERALYVVAGLGVLAFVLFPSIFPAALPEAELGAFLVVATVATLALGVLLLLDAYLSARTEIGRRQALFVLAGYALTLAVRVTSPLELSAPLPIALATLAVLVLAYGGPFAIVLALASSRVRGAARERPLWEDALLLGAIAGGVALGLIDAAAVVAANTGIGVLGYLLARPLLLAYGILRYQILEVETRSRAVAGAIVFLASCAVLVAAAILLDDAGAPTALLVALPFAAGAVAALVLAAPIAKGLLPRGASDAAERSRDVYRAALEEAVRHSTSNASSAERVLGALRDRLHISDREHALLEAQLRGSGGAASVGALYLGRYRVERVLGEGGFGRTFLAHDEQLGRKVVLKAARANGSDEARRILREGRTLARTGHPRIVTLHDVELVGSECVLVLEHVEGGSLAGRLRAEGPLPLADALRVADDVLAALEAAHAEGIVHRDVKPANVLLGRDGRAKLADFGIAQRPASAATASGLSLQGQHAGSLRYMSPEQVRGLPVDARTDLYSVAVTLYETLTGRTYIDFRGRAEFDVRLAILEEAPNLPDEALPPALNEILAAALDKDPARRPKDAAAMRAQLALVANL